ncbi:T-lymphocyte activation antigen CD80 [Pezoporus wallicus]|uniref:T-lymphocyte activation antigen CD80 n=1 Tax=Pezoporus wallicus TaxID=35540 RepID=UPI00254E36A1|nr:T-lymphocyte activation antigen CD80 [Pezoporus wallicus]XP_057266478.1 T-lymphocyte activation antigen CD80 [Pezoporus wallicus]XP_057266479.1 T-lymphocyte activation antigen CD80 [Pezoporus wallicus]
MASAVAPQALLPYLCSLSSRPRSYRKMVCLPIAPLALALRRWLGIGLFVLLCLSLGYAQEKKAVKSKVGEKVGLPCCHEIPSSESLQNYRVYWQKNITEVVLAYAAGERISEHNSARYENRTEIDPRNLTLWISPVEILDNGPYWCVVQHLRSSQNSVVVCNEPVNLFVTADFSEPNLTAEVSADSCESTELVVMCSSYGGFPKPRLSGALNNMSVVWNASWVTESNLSPYNITGKLSLNVTQDFNITCSVEYNSFTKSTSLLLRKTNDCVLPTVAPSYNVITASSIIIVIFLLAITLAARYLPRHVCSHCSKCQDSVEQDVKEGTKPPVCSKVTSETSFV